MKKDCEECNGTGERPCECCDGTGVREVSIFAVDLKAIRRLSDEDAEELYKIQEDGLRCMDQAVRLKQMNPKAAESYDRQLAETLKKLETQADEILK